MKCYPFLLLLHFLAGQSLPTLQLVEAPSRVANEFVGASIKDANGNICAAIMLDSDLSGFAFEANNGVVKVDEKNARTLVYLSAGERVLTLFLKGYKPLKLIFSDHGILLKQKEIWQLSVSSSTKRSLVPVSIVFAPSAPDSLFIDSTFVSNDTTFYLSHGAHRIAAQKRGFFSVEKEITVNNGANLHFFTFEAKEKPRLGFVEIVANPKGARIAVNGKIETSRKLTLDEGTYSIYAQLEGYKPDSAKIALKENRTRRVHFNLVPMYGALRVFPQPSSATIKLYRSGKLVAEHAGAKIFTDLLVGEYTLEVSHPNFKTKSEKIELVENKRVTREVVLY